MTELIVPKEFDDYKTLIMEPGAIKHGENNWMEPAGNKSSFIQMHDSMFHHLAASLAAGPNGNRSDWELGEDHLLYFITRAQMCYYRVKNKIVHPLDSRFYK